MSYATFTREDFSIWHYPYVIAATESDAQNVTYGWAGYPYDDEGGQYLGLRHTGSITSTRLDEVSDTNLPAYIAAH
jgi:hypothetical protein